MSRSRKTRLTLSAVSGKTSVQYKEKCTKICLHTSLFIYICSLGIQSKYVSTTVHDKMHFYKWFSENPVKIFVLAQCNLSDIPMLRRKIVKATDSWNVGQ